jgi:hypothetical protein
MNCDESLRTLLSSDDPFDPRAACAAGAARVHADACPACRSTLLRLESAERALRSAPPPPDAAGARERFLVRLRSAPVPEAPARPVVFRRRAWLAAAAAVVAAVGVWLASPDARNSDAQERIDSLLEAALRISEAPSAADRRRLAAELPGMAASEPADPATRELLSSLRADAEWLAGTDDPAAHAERFAESAGRLLARLRDAAERGDPAAAEREAARYGRVVERGVAANLRRAGGGRAPPEAVGRVERASARTLRDAETLTALFDEVPAAARPALRKALESASRGGFVPPGLRKKLAPPPTTAASDATSRDESPESSDAPETRPGNGPDFIPPGLLRKLTPPDEPPSGKGPGKPGKGPGHGRGKPDRSETESP